MSYTDKRCEACGKDDLPGNVHSSSLGAASFYYCILCTHLGAEQLGLAKEMAPEGEWIAYDPDLDSYVSHTGEVGEVTLNDGSTTKLRSEMVTKIKKDLNL